MQQVILLDLGNTLVHYYAREDFPPILEAGVARAGGVLAGRGFALPGHIDITRRLKEENYESADFRVRPLEGRLRRIFALPDAGPDAMGAACSHFMQPSFARAAIYEDTLPFLRELRASGLPVAIVSNTPWGSPAGLWRRELERHGIDRWIDHAVFCTDVGWRKPAPPIFQEAMTRLGAPAQDCLFIGDDPRWDRVGPDQLGMPSHIVQRNGQAGAHPLLDLLHEFGRNWPPR